MYISKSHLVNDTNRKRELSCLLEAVMLEKLVHWGLSNFHSVDRESLPTIPTAKDLECCVSSCSLLHKVKLFSS
jgi:hypothetical protein